MGVGTQTIGQLGPLAGVGTTAAISSVAASGTALSAAAGPIGLAVGAVMGIVSAILGHHEQAVKTEAQALSTVTPAVATAEQNIFAQLNSGQITPDAAKTAINSLPAAYESAVYNQYGVKKKSGNGPDMVEKNDILSWVSEGNKIIDAGGGSFTTKPVGGSVGLPSFEIDYKPISTVSNTTGSAGTSGAGTATVDMTGTSTGTPVVTSAGVAVGGYSLSWSLVLILFLIFVFLFRK